MAKITDSCPFGARVKVLSDYKNTVLENHLSSHCGRVIDMLITFHLKIAHLQLFLITRRPSNEPYFNGTAS